jgi:hypothetical protein
MRIDAPIITGSFSLNGDTFQDLGAYTTTGSNTFIGNQIIEGTISASELSGSIDYTNLRNVPTLVSGSSQIVNILSSLNTYTGSNDTINTNQNNRLDSLENKTGSLATTGSNSFFGTQTFSGSVFIANDLVVQGSSSIQYISASSVSIGTNIVQLNTATPSVRYAGLSVQDSGSSAGVTGSMLWDSLCNRWIYSNPSGVGYSGGMLLSGPRTQTLGTEPTLTCNYIAKSGGGDHLYDSCIIDDGTTTCIKNNLITTGTSCFGGTICANVNSNTFGNASSAGRSLILQAGSGNQVIQFKNCWGGDGTLYACGNATAFHYGFNTYSCSDVVFIANGGNVGFGCNNPGYTIDVKGTGHFTSAGGTMLIESTQPTNSSTLKIIQCSTGGNGNTDQGLVVQTNAADGTSNIAHFYDYNNGSPCSRLVIRRNGNVGLGITSPVSQLHMKGSIAFTEPGFDAVRIHTISHSHSNGSSANNSIGFNISDGAGDGTTAERMRIDGAGALVVTGMVCSAGRFISNVGSTTSTYGFTHCGASRWGRFGMPNSSYMYLETNADSGVYIDAQTRVAGYFCASGNIQGNNFLFSAALCGSGTKLGTGGYNTGYTPDGLYGGTATPNYISSPTGGTFRLGYTDNGSGLYGTAYGFDVSYKDGLNRCIDYDAIVMRNDGQGTRPFRVTSYGNIYGVSKNFRIKHPIPSMNDTHYLVHTSIEGPQADLIYRGKVQLVNGKAEVNIDLASRMTDGTFEVLCQDVQSYTTNESGWSLTKSYVIGNILHIEAQDETVTDIISWLVIGERNDDSIKNSAITDENGHVIVEDLKPEEGL